MTSNNSSIYSNFSFAELIEFNELSKEDFSWLTSVAFSTSFQILGSSSSNLSSSNLSDLAS